MRRHRNNWPRWVHALVAFGAAMLVVTGALGAAVGCVLLWPDIPRALVALSALGAGLLGTIPGALLAAWYSYATRDH